MDLSRNQGQGSWASAIKRPFTTDRGLWVLFPLLCIAEVLTHWTLLRLPYYWDEGGYYIPAAWDFWRLGTVIPVTTVRNAHPPLPSVLLAGWWHLTGFHILSTRIFMCVVTAVALLGVFRLVRQLSGVGIAAAVLLLTAVYPVWFAQSTLAHADMFAAAGTLWALSFYLGAEHHATPERRVVLGRAVGVALCFTVAVLSKETAIITPAALFCFEAALWIGCWRANSGRKHLAEQRRFPMLAALAWPALPLIAWYTYHRLRTGFTFGNPEYLRYNAEANLSAARILLSLWHRLIHLAVHMGMFVPVLLALVAVMVPALAGVPTLPRRIVWRIGVVLVANWVAFSILGGALLTRYLLPAFPLVLLLCAVAWHKHVRRWMLLTAVSLVAFCVGIEANPPYPFAPEDNLAYRDMIVLHQQAIAEVEHRYPGATVLSAWPVTADLQRPELGYLVQPIRTAKIDNFTAAEVAKAAQRPGDFDVAIIFSTKYNPPPGGLDLARAHSTSDARYFDSHRDLTPIEAARALGGTVVWQAERKGEWAAVLHFPRSYDARLTPTAALR